MLIYLFFILRGIYTYPLKVPAVAIGAISLVSSVMFTGAVIVLNIKNIDNLDDDYFDPFCYSEYLFIASTVFIVQFLG